MAGSDETIGAAREVGSLYETGTGGYYSRRRVGLEQEWQAGWQSVTSAGEDMLYSEAGTEAGQSSTQMKVNRPRRRIMKFRVIYKDG